MQNNFSLANRISAFSKLGEAIQNFLNDASTWQKLEEAVALSFYKNGWFDHESVLKALGGVVALVQPNQLNLVKASYPKLLQEHSPKTVGLIMAGNIPLVGFHDFLCVLLSGNRCKVKLSSQDPLLLPVLIQRLLEIEPRFAAFIQIESGFMKEIDAVVATGSNNSSRYFLSYFAHIPSIIRKNRTSVAVLTGDETREQLQALGNDVFQYYGLGCRNVSSLFVPEGYDFSAFFAAILDLGTVADNKKYFNNYSYNRTVYLLNSLQFLDNNFVAIKEDAQLSSPIGVIHYSMYANTEELNNKLIEKQEEIQCIVGAGSNHIPFGQAQYPSFFDYADGVDTMEFLVKL